MTPRTSFVLLVGVLASFPCAFAMVRPPMRLVLFYTYLSVVLLVGGFLGPVFTLTLLPGVTISAGSLCYGALMMTSVLLVIMARDAGVVRHVIHVVLVVNLFKLAVFGLTSAALRSPGVNNPFGTDPLLFQVSALSVAVGGTLIVAELLTLVVLFEWAKAHVPRPEALTAVYAVFFVLVLTLDGLLFPVLAQPFSPELAIAIAGDVQAKFLLAAAFSVPLLGFLSVFRSSFDAFRATPLELQEAVFRPRESLAVQVEEQHARLAAAQANYRNLVASTADAVISTSLDGTVRSWNRAAEALYGRAAAEAVGAHLGTILPPGRAAEVPSMLETVAAGGTVRGVEVELHRPDGSRADVSITVSPVRSPSGKVTGASAIARDVSDRRELERSLERQALHDALTGLPNRVLLADRLAHALDARRRSRSETAVIFLDLDQFKLINDGAGHAVGDEVLRAVAERLIVAVRAHDTVARVGGDEFVVLCEDTSLARADHVGARVLAALDEPVVTFVGIAEDCGLASAFDRWVLHRACADATGAFAAGVLPADGHVAVNVSAGNITDGTVEAMVAEALAATGLAPQRLVVEVTETTMMDDLTLDIGALESLHERGVAIAIDDFGTGFSSLTYLRRFPASLVKIDRSFTGAVDRRSEDRVIVDSVVGLSHAMGMRTVAEGVENRRQLDLLRAMGCDLAQGYLFSPPVPLAELAELAETVRHRPDAPLRRTGPEQHARRSATKP